MATDFTLQSELGEQVTLSDLRGKIVLVNFMFTRCYDICPILTGAERANFEWSAIRIDCRASPITVCATRTSRKS